MTSSYTSLLETDSRMTAVLRDKKTLHAAQARRLLPSISAWFFVSDSSKAAALAAVDGWHPGPSVVFGGVVLPH